MIKKCVFIICSMFCLTVSLNSSPALNKEIVVILSYQNENVNITLNKFIACLKQNDISCSITKLNLIEGKPEKILIEIKNQ